MLIVIFAALTPLPMTQRPFILYADDDADDRELLREYINMQTSNYEIIEASNGKEALLSLQQTDGVCNLPSLIILDLNMPILSGRETLAILKSKPETENVPVVVFTTSSSPHDEAFCKNFGVSMITKPQSVEGIKKAVTQLLDFLSSGNNQASTVIA